MSHFIFIVILLLLHFGLHVPLVIACIVTAVLWLVWKLKYVILAVIGLEWLLNRDKEE
jgi:hypothetical protein